MPDRDGRVCAIHQPNLFPRLSTLAKIFAADHWVILDDVQFTRRDYQHRCRLADLDLTREQWLSLSVHLRYGRSTPINQARIVQQRKCRRRVEGLLQQYYGRTLHWPSLVAGLQTVSEVMTASDRLVDITEASTRNLLDILAWPGHAVRSSELAGRTGRSERLADLTHKVGASHYLCGEGGLRYLNHAPFNALGLRVDPFRTPTVSTQTIWSNAKRVSAVWALMKVGPDALRRQLEAAAAQERRR